MLLELLGCSRLVFFALDVVFVGCCEIVRTLFFVYSGCSFLYVFGTCTRGAFFTTFLDRKRCNDAVPRGG